MPTLSDETIVRLLAPYAPNLPPIVIEKLSIYLDLLLKWNIRTNLTAIREPEEIVQRHFGESLFAGSHIPEAKTLLDFGSGAGLPGLPIQLLRPDLVITLSESQHKKAAFLREAVRVLDLKTEVWAGRVEAMPRERVFDVVTMRAVDKMTDAVPAALSRVRVCLVVFATAHQAGVPLPGFEALAPVTMPNAKDQHLLLALRSKVD